eukprot:CAMPEP_0115447210 /NCGR_PEP_ID=MMETSP0271-20121206/39852_1 /TAXON_ID=71861 /ORGANISM="Scrippsiella trochoidea, Strain CCMP3099" /LENGTH=225 /DNA_ID=CAMNT_0002873281 /DNA_START=39 /DNA_END=716 /DNA_ORIENTATION=-
MPGLVSCACGIFGVAAAFGALRLVSFVRRIKDYRSTAKGAALAAPSGFAIAGATAARAKELHWFVIDDQVMGGKSQSALEMTDAGTIEFAGTINSNGGGFSSCRTLGDEGPLGFPASAHSIEVTAAGDGRQYMLTLHTADSWTMSVPSWAHAFSTAPAGREQTHRLKLKDFVPRKQGQPVKGVELDPANVTGVGLSRTRFGLDGKPINDFEDGPFKVTLRRLAVI